jgi:hypothetical protein
MKKGWSSEQAKPIGQKGNRTIGQKEKKKR